eukprot:5959941-Amphidinium_carterae.1
MHRDAECHDPRILHSCVNSLWPFAKLTMLDPSHLSHDVLVHCCHSKLEAVSGVDSFLGSCDIQNIICWMLYPGCASASVQIEMSVELPVGPTRSRRMPLATRHGQTHCDGSDA